MGRVRKILHYDATLSNEENARRNNVTLSGINWHIKHNNVDRRFEKTASLIAECRKYYQSHKKANKGQVARGVTEVLKKKAGKRVIEQIEESGKGKHQITCSRYFVDKHWEYITTDAVFTEHNAEKAENRKTENLDAEKIDANKKELFSECLKDIPQMFRIAEETDISEFRKFLFEKPNMPMLFIGSGGMDGAFPALLYGMNSGLGHSITPYMLASLSDATIKNSRCLLMSTSGKNDDIVYAANRCVELNAENTACFTYVSGNEDDEENEMLKILQGTSAKIFSFRNPCYLPRPKRGFISSRTKFFKYALMYRAFTNVDSISNVINVDLDEKKCFTYRLNKEGVNLPNLRKINHFIALYGSYGESAARDLESVMAETGLASVQVVDYRNYCHGRFIFTGNHTENYSEPRKESDVAVVMYISPRERTIAKQLLDGVIPYKTPIVLIETEYDSPLATLEMMIKSNVFISYVGETCYGINPNSPMNYSNIDKTFPISQVKFKRELEKEGNLSYYPRLHDGCVEEVQILDNIVFNPNEVFHFPINDNSVIQFYSEALPENQVLSNHFDCIIKFKGYEFLGVEQLYGILTHCYNEEAVLDIMNASTTPNAKSRGKNYHKDWDEPIKQYEVIAICHLYKYLNCPQFRDRLRQTYGKILVECPPGSDTHFACQQDYDTNILIGNNCSGRTMMIVRDMMKEKEEDAIKNEEKKKGRKLKPTEKEHVLELVYDEVRQKYDNDEKVIEASQTALDILHNHNIPVKRKHRPELPAPLNIDRKSKCIIVNFDYCLFDTSVDYDYRQSDGEKDFEKVYSLIPQYSLYEGWREVFEWMKANNVKMGILSLIKREIIEKAIETFDIPCDSFISYLWGEHKPSPNLGFKIQELLNVRQEQILYVGNTLEDEAQARCSGMRFVGSVWGCDKETADKLNQRCPVISNPREIIDLINLKD